MLFLQMKKISVSESRPVQRARPRNGSVRQLQLRTGRLYTSTADEAHQHHDDSDDQQDVDEAADGIRGDQAKQPQNDKYDSDCVEHDSVLSELNGDALAVQSVCRYGPVLTVRYRTLRDIILLFTQPRHPPHEARQAGHADQAGDQAAGDQQDHVLRLELDQAEGFSSIRWCPSVRCLTLRKRK
jgi:hypothetical protein